MKFDYNKLMQSSSKEQIRANRQKMRMCAKIDLVESVREVKSVVEKIGKGEPPEQQTAASKLQRKTSIIKLRRKSEDMSIFENPCRNRDVYINNRFVDLFRVQEKLGQGAQSIVKKCTQILTGKVYAVKCFRSTDCQLISMLKSQYKNLKILNHPNIIQAFNLFVDENQKNCHLILQYYPHPHLRDYLDKHQKLQDQEVRQIVSQLLLAATFMHEKGICHRDIKSENVLYNPTTMEIKLIDFDISKINRKLGQRQEMWSMTGTLYYKAPQMFAGKYNQLIDVWSIGVTTYELLTGKLPFMKEYLNDTIEDIKNAEPQYPEYLSKFAKDFIKRCLTKNPQKRMTAKQALSTPFIIQCESGSVLSSPSPEKLNQSFDSKSKSWVCDEEEEYKMEVMKCFEAETPQNNQYLDSGDIGIRCIDGNNLDLL